MSKRCDFADADFEIMLQIALYGTSSRLRKQALRDPKMTLQGLLVTGRQLGRSNVQARHIEKDKKELQREDTKINLVKAKASTNTCRNCIEEWPHTQGPCPAKGKQCRNCNKFNHFAILCRSPRANIRQGHTLKQNQPRRRDNIRSVPWLTSSSMADWSKLATSGVFSSDICVLGKYLSFLVSFPIDVKWSRENLHDNDLSLRIY